MAGRPAKPIDLHIVEGRKHLTKREIAERKNQENSLKSNTTFRPNEKVKNNPVALKMFKKLKKLYAKIDYVEGLDENIINRYCLLSAESNALESLLNKMSEDVENCKEYTERIQLYKSITGIERNLNQNRNMLLKIEDRLFLNPTSRVKNVPKKPEEKPKTEFDRKFGNV